MNIHRSLVAAALVAAASSATAGWTVAVPETNTVDSVTYETVLVYDLDLDTGTASLIRVHPIAGDYTIKNQIVAKLDETEMFFTVTKLGDSAFADNPGLLKCTVPNSVLEIGDCVFANCTALAEVEFNYGLRKVGSRAFVNTAVREIALPDSVIDIGGKLNAGTLSTSQITVSDSSHFVYDEYGVLYNRDKTKLYACPTRAEGTIAVPASVTNIAEDAFFGCHRLAYLNLPATLNTIGEGAFNVAGIWNDEGFPYTHAPEGTPHLVSLFFNGPVPNAAEDIFGGAPDSLVVYALDEAWDGMDEWMGRKVMPLGDTNPPVLSYTDSSGITWHYRIVNNEVELYNEDADGNPIAAVSPKATTGIPYKESEESLVTRKALKIPESINGYAVTKIGPHAFDGCASLPCLGIPTSVREIGDYAFKGCSAVKSIDQSDNVPFNTQDGKVSLPVGIGALGLHVFEGMTAASVSMPYTLTSVAGNPIAGCDFVTTLSVDPNNPRFTTDGNVMYDKAKTTAIALPANSDTSVSFPSSVTIFGDEAFFGCINLRDLQVPNSLSSIGARAFSGCRSIESLAMPETLSEIGEAAFSGCERLLSVKFAGNAPTAADDIYDGTPATLKSYAPAEAAGFSGSTWKGRPLVVEATPDLMRQTYDDGTVQWMYNIKDGKAVITGASGDAAGKTVTIPSEFGTYVVSALQEDALDGLSGVAAYNSMSALFVAKNGCLYSADEKTLVRVPDGIVLPYTITTDKSSDTVTITTIPGIKDSGNPGNDGTSVTTNVVRGAVSRATEQVAGDISFETLLAGVTAIARHAFYGCNASFEDSDETTSESSIGGETGFNGANGAPYIRQVMSIEKIATKYSTTFTLPASVTSVADGAFMGSGVALASPYEPPTHANVTAGQNVSEFSVRTSGESGSSLEENTSYIGWIESNGRITGTVAAKTSKARKGVVKVTGTAVRIGAKKTRIKSMAELDALGGLTLVKDLSKSKVASEKAAFNAFRGKCWTLAYESSSPESPLLAGYTTISAAVGNNGKVRVKGTTADGAKISGTAQMAKCGDGYVVPIAVQTHAGKSGGIAVLLVVEADGSVSADTTAELRSVIDGRTATTKLVLVDAGSADGAAGDRLLVGEAAAQAGYELDETLKGWRPRYTAATGMLKGGVTFYRNGKRVKANVVGVVVDGVGYATAVAKGTASFPALVVK